MDWRISPSDEGGQVIVPILTAQIVDEKAIGLQEAVLAPSARYILAPTGVASNMGIYPQALKRVTDPLFPGFDLWLWKTAPIKVVGAGSFSDHLLLNLPIAFDSTARLKCIVLGERFFWQVRIHFNPEKPGDSWIEQFRHLD